MGWGGVRRGEVGWGGVRCGEAPAYRHPSSLTAALPARGVTDNPAADTAARSCSRGSNQVSLVQVSGARRLGYDLLCGLCSMCTSSSSAHSRPAIFIVRLIRQFL